jgi:D-arabinose 1-dehydrogenase-like Zn-dependent alcohol dehydrogenase
MQALQLETYDGPSALKLVDIPEPKARTGEILVDVHAIGINFPDLLATQGRYQHKPALPFVPGCEIAGVVREAPEGSGWSAGQRAAAFVWQGGYAEVAAVPAHALMPVLDDTSLSTAAAIIVNYHTVLFALDRRGKLQEGETAMILGAGGGIGTAALQVARGLGASKTIGGVANEEQAATARDAGADEVIVLEEGRSDGPEDSHRLVVGRLESAPPAARSARATLVGEPRTSRSAGRWARPASGRASGNDLTDCSTAHGHTPPDRFPPTRALGTVLDDLRKLVALSEQERLRKQEVVSCGQ